MPCGARWGFAGRGVPGPDGVDPAPSLRHELAPGPGRTHPVATIEIN